MEPRNHWAVAAAVEGQSRRVKIKERLHNPTFGDKKDWM